MVDFNIEQLMKMLMGMAGRGSSGYQSVRYGGIPAHFTQAYGYQPGIMEGLSKSFFPHRQRIAPPTVLQRDWETMVRVSQQRSMMAAQSTSDISPVAQRSMEMFFEFTQGQGKGREAFRSFRKDNPFISQYLMGPISNMMFGPGVNAQKQAAYMDVSRHFAGRQFNVPGINSYKQGLPSDAAGEVTRRLYGITYKDDLGMYKRFAHFGVQDMSDIMRMGLDYGMDLPVHKKGMQKGKINLNSLTNKVKGLASVIDAGMAIFKTMDKEKVIENIMELTQGRIPIGDTLKLENIMYKLNAVSRRTGLTVKYMQKISTEGARLFEQIGIAGDVGASVASVMPLMMKNAVQGVYGTEKFIPRQYTPQKVADLGGQQTMRQRRMVMTASYAGSKNLGTYGFLYTNADEQGKLDLVESLRKGVAPNRKKEQELLTEYEKYYAREGYTNPLRAAQVRMENERRKGKSDILRQTAELYGPQEIHAMALVAQTKNIEARVFGVDELGKTINTIDIAKLKKDEAYRLNIETVAQDFFREKFFLHEPKEARSMAIQWSRGLTTDPRLRREDFMRQKADLIIDRQVQDSRRRTSIIDNLKGSVAFRGTPQSLINAMVSALPGSSIEMFKFEGQLSPTNLNKADWEKRMSEMGPARFLNMAMMYELADNTFLTSRKKAVEKISGYTVWELAGLDVNKEMFNLSEKVDAYRGLSKSKMQKRVLEGLGDAFTGMGKTDLKDAEKYFGDRGLTHRTFLDYVNKGMAKQGIDRQVTLAQFHNSSQAKESFKRTWAYMHHQGNKDVKSGTKIAVDILHLDKHFEGKLLAKDLGTAMSSVMSGKKYKELKSKLNQALNIKDHDDRVEALDKLKPAFISAINEQYRKQYKDTKKSREESFRISTESVHDTRGTVAQNMLDSYDAGARLNDKEAEALMEKLEITPQELYEYAPMIATALGEGSIEAIEMSTRRLYGRNTNQLMRHEDPIRRSKNIFRLVGHHLSKTRSMHRDTDHKAFSEKLRQRHIKRALGAVATIEELESIAATTKKDTITDEKAEKYVSTVTEPLKELVELLKGAIEQNKKNNNTTAAVVKAGAAVAGVPRR